jgi:hypothetical protein
MLPHLSHPSGMFNFITGNWLRVRKQIEMSKRGTAVDQWGWGSKEMWTPFTKDSELMDDLALLEIWALPIMIATGYLLSRAVSCAIKVSQAGLATICISDAIRRLEAKCLRALQVCLLQGVVHPCFPKLTP